ncbi:hypothetical protein [Plantactinospora sp. KBS50]|uniref:hypothetical protein n=1 Tax=Plantactinospora sp. KBS50 TaxID=2024580 RepID=UPI000BAB08E5|nr:hypothetical protein [Plantactinospora sp. KBS50]ASW55380.1 hypothetical protein CIK06_16215 [Plantactinospora sp. KBS50]
MAPNPFRILVVRGFWNPPQAGAIGNWPWSPAFCRAVFQNRNGISVADYWRRSSFGILNLEFDVDRTGSAGLNLLGLDANRLTPRRLDAINAVRDRARAEGVVVDGYHGLVALTNPPPCNAGAVGSAALFDQNGFLEFYQHEIGHVLGFQHAFGPDGGDPGAETVYEDPYCVMGFTGPQSFTVPPPPEVSSVVTPLRPDFWRSGRRVATANMHRTYPAEFAPWVARVRLGEVAVVGASSAVAEIGSPGAARPLAVLTLPGGAEITAEYRVNTVDDRGITPAVVIHSIGLRDLGLRDNGEPWGEVRPIWYEGTLQPRAGASRQIAPGVTVRVESTDFPGFVLGPRPPVVQLRFV